ncbi:isochorismatase family protein [Pseudoalteromonas fenneropenaei]|uniref:Isochorismatase family protein n=1 Tax=Pseudoalteromonas fenneropenaei TaxID=1737459 RepID=A0ABV7CJ04_9GAMM
MKTALIIIDTQDSFFHTDYWREDEFAEFRANLTQVVTHFQQQNWPIVKVLHSREDVENSPFNPKSGLVKAMAFLPVHYDKVIYKSVHNAFTDTGLARWLMREGITKLVITGIRTEQCCETTTRVASDLGYQVEYVLDATLTFPMVCDITGQHYSTDDIKARTQLVLNKRFATITNSHDYK